jgi:hypothetical protein
MMIQHPYSNEKPHVNPMMRRQAALQSSLAKNHELMRIFPQSNNSFFLRLNSLILTQPTVQHPLHDNH